MHSSQQKRQHPLLTLSGSGGGGGCAVSISSSTSSSRETAEPVTPIEADEEFIAQLWEQVRSKTKTSGSIGIANIGVGKANAIAGTTPDRIPAHRRGEAPRILTHRPSLTFRDSPDGTKTMVILDLPGVHKPDVHISFQHKQLIVSYKSVEETEKWERDKVIQELKERRCVRAIPIPESVRPDHIRASMPESRLFISYRK